MSSNFVRYSPEIETLDPDIEEVMARIIDFWVYAAFQLQQISRETGEDAHVYVEPTDTETPFRESIEFWNAQEIIRRAEDELRRDHSVQRLVRRWLKFMAAAAPRAPKVVRKDDVDR